MGLNPIDACNTGYVDQKWCSEEGGIATCILEMSCDICFGEDCTPPIIPNVQESGFLGVGIGRGGVIIKSKLMMCRSFIKKIAFYFEK